jgi:thiol-disulfide isomerase/thioredoxin
LNVSCLDPFLPDRLVRAVRALRVLCALWAAAALVPAHAAPRAVEVFDRPAWGALQAGLTAPAIVVFTATYCAHCPAVMAQLAQDKRRLLPSAQLIAVVMDAVPGDDDAKLLRDPHHRPLDRLFAFQGQAAALRHAVDPSWRGITPYVAFLHPGEPPRWVTGPPKAQDLAAWARKR